MDSTGHAHFSHLFNMIQAKTENFKRPALFTRFFVIGQTKQKVNNAKNVPGLKNKRGTINKNESK